MKYCTPRGTKIGPGKCQTASNIRYSIVGSKPSWYINQGQHTETFYILNEEKKSIASSRCGVANLSMSINVLIKKNVTPETLFKGGYKNKIY